jgi:hypothetical protein
LRPTLLQGLVALAAAICLIAIAVADVTGPRSCSDADASLKYGLLKNAQEAYTAILEEEPTSACAQEGMAFVVTGLCARAAAARTAGYEDEAKEAYKAVFAIEPPRGTYDECLVRAKPEPVHPGGCPDGDKEACAVRGPRGPRGRPGPQGAPGKNGRNGRNGRNGENGRDGTTLCCPG